MLVGSVIVHGRIFDIQLSRYCHGDFIYKNYPIDSDKQLVQVFIAATEKKHNCSAWNEYFTMSWRFVVVFFNQMHVK